jgi:penicillin-binding protein 2
LTNIDLPGEAKGFIPSPEWKKSYFESRTDQVWTDGDTYNLAIGQGFIAITPLQVANGFAAIANGGILYEPQIVKKIVDSERKVVEEKKPKIIRDNFIDPQNLKVVREGMRQAVTGKNSPLASSVTLNSLPVPVAAKTGTAQLRKDAAGKDLMNSWVSAFAPYDDPQIVITFMMEDVHEGQLAVLPVAKNVLQWYFGPKDQPASLEQAVPENPDQTITGEQVPVEIQDDQLPADVPVETVVPAEN